MKHVQLEKHRTEWQHILVFIWLRSDFLTAVLTEFPTDHARRLESSLSPPSSEPQPVKVPFAAVQPSSSVRGVSYWSCGSSRALPLSLPLNIRSRFSRHGCRLQYDMAVRHYTLDFNLSTAGRTATESASLPDLFIVIIWAPFFISSACLLLTV